VNEHSLSRSQRAADVVTEFCGSWTFIIAFSGITLGWMALNTWRIFTAFDPYPYILLNLFLTVVSTFQSPLIMMSQNRQMERDRDAVQGLHEKLDALRSIMEPCPTRQGTQTVKYRDMSGECPDCGGKG
jgi:Protein of unknown function (DUF1003)